MPLPNKAILDLFTSFKMLPISTTPNSMYRSPIFRHANQKRSNVAERRQIAAQKDDEAQTKTVTEKEEVPEYKSKRPGSTTRLHYGSVTFNFNYESIRNISRNQNLAFLYDHLS
jgi:hypothetical protein